MGEVIPGSLLFYSFRAKRNLTFHLPAQCSCFIFNNVVHCERSNWYTFNMAWGMIQYFVNNRRETSLMNNCCTSLLDFGGLIFYLAYTVHMNCWVHVNLFERKDCCVWPQYGLILGVNSGPSSGCKQKPCLKIQIISVGRTKDLSFSKYWYVCLVCRKRTSFSIRHGWNLSSRLPS